MKLGEEKEKLSELYENLFGNVPFIVAIKGGGGTRKYFRLDDGKKKVIGTIGEDIEENKVFFHLDKTLNNSGINVPEIYAVSKDEKAYLLQDLGDLRLYDLLEGKDRIFLAKKALIELINIQNLPSNVWEDKVGFPPFSERLIRWDLNYFKYDFLKPADIPFDEEKLEDDFENIVKDLLVKNMILGFMYRDFQSRNIMVNEDKFWFIDFQSARKGPIVYDAASFIWQAKAPFTFEEREELGLWYCENLSKVKVKNTKEILSQLNPMIVFRTLQVLGAYGMRGIIERKAHFIESIPFAIKNLVYLNETRRLDHYPEIKKITKKLAVSKWAIIPEKDDNILTVSIFSFSYKNGYPEDKSGNGGGFMFDCRALPNPGRYMEYKSKTGLDTEVIEFIEKTSDATCFVNSALDLVIPSVKRYVERNFTSLQVGFGCTGGQHRSVYCAQLFARKLKKLFPEIKVKINHREQKLKSEI